MTRTWLLLSIIIAGGSGCMSTSAASGRDPETIAPVPLARHAMPSAIAVEVVPQSASGQFTLIESAGLKSEWIRLSAANAAATGRTLPAGQSDWSKFMTTAFEEEIAVERLEEATAAVHAPKVVAAIAAAIPGAQPYILWERPNAASIAAARSWNKRIASLGGGDNLGRSNLDAMLFPDPADRPFVAAVVSLQVSRARSASDALDYGRSFGRILAINRSTTVPRSSNAALYGADSAADPESVRGTAAYWSPLSESDVNRKKDELIAHPETSKDWRATWFTDYPGDAAYFEGEARIKLRVEAARRASGRPLGLEVWEPKIAATADQTSNADPYEPVFKDIAGHLTIALSSPDAIAALRQGLRKWSALYGFDGIVDEGLVDPEKFSRGSKLRNLAACLSAETTLLTKLSRKLEQKFLAADFGRAIRENEAAEDKILTSLKSARGQANLSMFFGMVGSAAATTGQISSARAGDYQSANAFAAMNVGMTTQTMMLLDHYAKAASSIDSLSEQSAKEIAAEIGPITVEIDGVATAVSVGSLRELREKLIDLFKRSSGI